MAEQHTFPQELPDWNNLQILHRNTLPPRPHFFIYNDESAALTRDISLARAQCLSGKWKFHLSKTPLEGPIDFYAKDFDTSKSGFHDVQVPGMWQLQGYGKGPHYTNVQYPWPVDPPNVSLEDNECGRYVTKFFVDKTFTDDNNAQLRLRFEGVDSAFTVWVNGEKIGYSQGSRNPSEFDVTDVVNVDNPEGNVLAVEVYQRCDGSYIEDQDQWWLSGIFRDVYLHSFPAVHPIDFQIETDLDHEYRDAVLKVKIEMSADCEVSLKLLDEEKKEIATVRKTFERETSDIFMLPISSPHKWTAETPYLYGLVLDFGGSVIHHRVGFRKTELIKGIFHVNGRPIKIRGANRHEHHPDSGRTVPYEFLKHDLLLMKSHNLNAIRTCHQINDTRLYELADELGLWILDEADLECHGFEVIGGDASPASYISDNPEWEAAYVDRATQMVQRDKNYTCVFMWSLGNEAFYGRNHQAMYDAIRHIDQTRLVHYEGDQEAKTADVYSRMYSSVDTIIQMAKETCPKSNKPLILCEYIHAMGNGPGAIKEYIDAFYSHPHLMGGFIWEWCNHGLRTKTIDGEEFMGYGGDFGDVPNDYNFIMDGCVFSDHTPTPGLTEYAKAVEPVQSLSFSIDDGKVMIINRYDFLSLDHLSCNWEIVVDGLKSVSGREVGISKDIEPHTEAVLRLDGFREKAEPYIQAADREAYVRISFQLKKSCAWAAEGHEVAFGEFQISKPQSLTSLIAAVKSGTKDSVSSSRPTVQQKSPSTLSITSASKLNVWEFDLARGCLHSWKRAGKETISVPIRMDFYRALTDNDREKHGKEWLESRLHQTKHHVRQVRWRNSPETTDILEVEIKGRIAPPVLAWAVDVTWLFTFVGDSVSLKIKGVPHGPMLPTFFARIGISLGLLNISNVSWWGRGPGEGYNDKKLSQSFGNWNSSVDDLFVDYEFPQDCGNRTDVRRVTFSGPNIEGDDSKKEPVLCANFGDLDGASFSALNYTTADLDECTHPYELKKRKRTDTIVRLDWKHHGLGTGSCGPPTMPQYQLKAEPFEVEILLA